MTAGAQVFLVDDQPAVLKALARLLGSAGYRVSAYATAQAFLDGGHADAEGCLVLDMSMPGMDGPALQRALAASASRLPVIFLTGHGDIDSGIRAMKHGAADFLTKPVDDQRLIAAIELALQRNRDLRQADGELDAIRARLHTLTPREAEVMNLVAAVMARSWSSTDQEFGYLHPAWFQRSAATRGDKRHVGRSSAGSPSPFQARSSQP